MNGRTNKGKSPPLPAWINEAVRPAWADEALAASIAHVNEKLCEGKMTRRPQLHAQVKDPRCFCCGVPIEVLLERSGRGLQALFAHRLIVGALFRQFAGDSPLPAHYAEMFMRVIVPTYNAVWLDVRRCVECGVGFDLHSPAEVTMVRQCPRCAKVTPVVP